MTAVFIKKKKKSGRKRQQTKAVRNGKRHKPIKLELKADSLKL